MIMIEIQYSVNITGEPMHTTSKQWHHAPQLYQLSSDTLLPAMFNPLYSSTNQQLFKNTFCNQGSP